MKKGALDLSLSAIVGIVLTVLLILVLIWFLFPNIIQGAKEIPACNAPKKCFIDKCGDGYTETTFFGDGWCEDEKQGNVCCYPTDGKSSSAVAPGDVRITAGGDVTKSIPNNGVVEMRFEGDKAHLELDMAFDGKLAQYACYGLIKPDGEASRTVSIEKLFTSSMPADDSTLRETKVDELTGDAAKCEPPKRAELTIQKANLLKSFGKETKYSIVMLDRKECEGKQVRACNPVYTHSIIVKVPDRRPAISLREGTVEFSKYEVNLLPIGSHRLTLEIEEPYPFCDLDSKLDFTVEDGAVFNKVLSQFELSGSPTYDCFEADRKEIEMQVNIPDDVVRGIPFSVMVATQTGTGPDDARVEETFQFRIPEHEELRVIGPASGLAREKSVDIVCSDITCQSKMEIGIIDDPFECDEGTFDEVETSTVEGSNRFRYTIKEEDESHKYVCVKQEKAGESLYALGLWRGVPSPITIDNQSPQVEVKFDFIRGKVSFTCQDTGEDLDLRSGCGENPFSYAYVSDPLRFAGFIVPFDDLFGLDNFRACPDANANSQWVLWRGMVDEMDYLGQDVRVICVRATDNAGNHAVKSRLLFSTTQAVGLLLQTTGATEVVR